MVTAPLQYRNWTVRSTCAYAGDEPVRR